MGPCAYIGDYATPPLVENTPPTAGDRAAASTDVDTCRCDDCSLLVWLSYYINLYPCSVNTSVRHCC